MPYFLLIFVLALEAMAQQPAVIPGKINLPEAQEWRIDLEALCGEEPEESWAPENACRNELHEALKNLPRWVPNGNIEIRNGVMNFYGLGAIGGGHIGGSGRTTQPSPVDTTMLAETLQTVAGKVLIGWLQQYEYQFRNAQASKEPTTEDQANLPLGNKLFGGEKTIYQVIRNTKVQMRTTDDCKDEKGLVVRDENGIVEGYAFAKHNGEEAICLNLKTIVAAHDSGSYRRHVIALALHEFGHRVGLDEKQAKALQDMALADFLNSGIDSYLAQLANLADRSEQSLSMLTEDRSKWMEDPTRYRHDKWTNWIRSLADFRTRLFPCDGKMLFAPMSDFQNLYGSVTQMEMVRDVICAEFSGNLESRSLRESCGRNLSKGFGRSGTITARLYRHRQRETDPGWLYESVSFSRPETKSGMRGAMREASRRIEAIEAAVRELNAFTLTTYFHSGR